MTDDEAAIRGLAKKVAKTSKETRDQARASQGSFRSVQLTDGPVEYYDEDGNKRLIIGAVGDNGEFTIQEVGAEAPPTPTQPDTFPWTSAIGVQWDGTFDNANSPMDLNRVEIHASQTGPTFECTDETQVSVFMSRTGGTYLFPANAAEGDWYFRLVAVNNSGGESEPSEAAMNQALTITESTDNQVPPQVANLVVEGGVKSLFLKWDAVTNADPVVYWIYGGTDISVPTDATHLIGKSAGPRMVVGKVYDDVSLAQVEPTPGKTYYFKIIARDFDGPGPASAAVGGTPIQINSPDIATNAIIARTIKANEVTADKLETILQLVTTLIVGSEAVQSLKLDAGEGFVAKDAGGNVLFKIPVVAGQPIFIRSDILAESITALGQVSLRDTQDALFPHELGQGAKFRLNNGVGAPSTKPSQSFNYPVRAAQAAPNSDANDLYSNGTHVGGMLNDAGTSLICAYWGFSEVGSKSVFYSVNLSTGVTTHLMTSPGGRQVLAMCKISTSTTNGVRKYAVLYYVPGSSNTQVMFYDHLWNYVASSAVVYPWSAQVSMVSTGTSSDYKRVPAMTWDGSNICFFQPRASDNKLFLGKMSSAGVTGTNTDTGVTLSANSWIHSAQYGVFDYSLNRFIVTDAYTNQVYAFNTTPARQAADEWPLTPGGISAAQALLYWNPNTAGGFGRFEMYEGYGQDDGGIPYGDPRIVTYGRHIWGSGSSKDIQRISHLWADSAGTTKTLQGQRAVLSPAVKRAYYRVTLPTPPSPATRAYYYWGDGPDTSAVTQMYEQGFLSGGATTFDIEVPVFSGTNPPTVPGSFGSATPSEFFSEAADANGPLFKFKGDGDWRLAPLTGAVVAYAGTTAPSGFLLCQGQSLLRADYPALFAVIGITYGAADGTHFNVPNLKSRVPVGVDGAEPLFDTLGETGGATTHILTSAQMPSHSHALTLGVSATAAASGGSAVDNGSGALVQGPATGRFAKAVTLQAPIDISAVGGGGAHPNVQPYIALNYIIKT